MFKTQVLDFVKKIEELKKTPENSVIGNVFYLNEDEIVCMDRTDGHSRYPYFKDGAIMWVYSTGFMFARKHGFAIFHDVRADEEPRVEFYGSIKNPDGTFLPVSITGASKQMFEPGVVRYCVFTRECPIFIAKTPDAIFAVRMFLTEDLKFNFTSTAINTSDKDLDLYMASYIEPLLNFSNTPGFWDRFSLKSKYLGDRKHLFIRRMGDTMATGVLNQVINGAQPYDEQHTTMRKSFIGGYGRNLASSPTLKYGRISNPTPSIATVDFSTFGDLYNFKLKKGEDTRIDQQFEYAMRRTPDESYTISDVDIKALDAEVATAREKYAEITDGMRIKYGKLNNMNLNNEILNKFLRTVQHSITFCSNHHDWTGDNQGIRDVYQQIESYIPYDPAGARENIVMYFNYFFDNGRTPRALCLPKTPWGSVVYDPDEYVDQGLWVISCVYNYLCYTDDYSILDELCTYYKISDNQRSGTPTTEKFTILDHLLRIMDYFIRNLDEEYGSFCLRILKGDWNDAINALGKSLDGDKPYGSGVSVMATAQLYENFDQMCEILKHIGGYDELCDKYMHYQRKLVEGLKKHAVVGDKGDEQIVHGWGDKISYKVGGLCDEDGKRRRGVISTAFWGLSGLIRETPELKDSIMRSYKILDSKYGFKAFDHPFTPDMNGVGRINVVIPGTGENSCAYVHAGVFANMSLFTIGESEWAWKQVEKTIPLTHEFINATPFVMCNQYCTNEEYSLDGDTLFEWTTGSNPTTLRTFYKYGFGIAPDTEFLRIAPAKVQPSDEASVYLTFLGKKVTVNYKNEGSGERKFFVDGKEVECGYDELSDTRYIKIPKSEIKGDVVIDVID